MTTPRSTGNSANGGNWANGANGHNGAHGSGSNGALHLMPDEETLRAIATDVLQELNASVDGESAPQHRASPAQPEAPLAQPDAPLAQHSVPVELENELPELPELPGLPPGLAAPHGLAVPSGLEFPSGLAGPSGLVVPSGLEVPSGLAGPSGLAVPTVPPVVPPTMPPGQAPGPTFYFIQESAAAASEAADPAPAAMAGEPWFDVQAVRRDFPILSELVNGRPLVWFDNAATTHKPQAVIDRVTWFYAHENSNVHRGAHALAEHATEQYEDARATVADYIGAPADSVVFTRGTTEAINLVAQAWGRRNIGPGDEIVLSLLEHHANIVPWQQLADEKRATLRVIGVDNQGQVDLASLENMLSPRTRLVAIAHISNVLGTVVPVAQVIAAAHRVGARALVDGAQAVAHMPVDVTELDADFYAFSGHKVFGPTGIGALYAKPEILHDMPPWQGGGSMIKDVTFERTWYNDPPSRFEAGTGNIAGAVGLAAALDYVSKLGLPAIAGYEHGLVDHAIRQLESVPGLRLIGTAPDKASTLTFVLDGCEPAQVGAALDKQGIAVRAGHHCAQPILRHYGLESAVRPSLAMYNTRAEVDLLAAALGRLAANARRRG